VLSIYQQTRTGGKEGYPVSPNYQNINVCLTPMKTELQLAYGAGQQFMMYNCVVYDTTITLSNDDKLVDQDGLIYYVEGMPVTVNNPLLSFTKVIVKQKA
jgi:hypothetical protein